MDPTKFPAQPGGHELPGSGDSRLASAAVAHHRPRDSRPIPRRPRGHRRRDRYDCSSCTAAVHARRVQRDGVRESEEADGPGVMIRYRLDGEAALRSIAGQPGAMMTDATRKPPRTSLPTTSSSPAWPSAPTTLRGWRSRAPDCAAGWASSYGPRVRTRPAGGASTSSGCASSTQKARTGPPATKCGRCSGWKRRSSACGHGTTRRICSPAPKRPGHGGGWLVLGEGVRGGHLLEKWPGLATARLDQGADLAATTDYRRVLAECLAAGLPGCDALPGWQPGTALGLFGA